MNDPIIKIKKEMQYFCYFLINAIHIYKYLVFTDFFLFNQMFWIRRTILEINQSHYYFSWKIFFNKYFLFPIQNISTSRDRILSYHYISSTLLLSWGKECFWKTLFIFWKNHFLEILLYAKYLNIWKNRDVYKISKVGWGVNFTPDTTDACIAFLSRTEIMWLSNCLDSFLI